jgi:hypothetical protein
MPPPIHHVSSHHPLAFPYALLPLNDDKTKGRILGFLSNERPRDDSHRQGFMSDSTRPAGTALALLWFWDHGVGGGMRTSKGRFETSQPSQKAPFGAPLAARSQHNVVIPTPHRSAHAFSSLPFCLASDGMGRTHLAFGLVVCSPFVAVCWV